ncbi:protein ENHANCED DOWNY MILDEW 2-like [Quillaja saponaria]|uniref:Protein ENHANCED DOWNY MILDEW 2-like n=1 Tax=Quillaja saponaria TaxID=32244 RepID=A0AAD7PM50_QUISA|nr:protein ENHANCED DOWNY MILDEW 2-like [Quillaja saponaria]
MWDYLSKVFTSYEVRPSQNDLLYHMHLIDEAVKRDVSLAKSKLVLMFLEENPGKTKPSDEDLHNLERPGFIVDDSDEEMVDVADEDEFNEDEDELFDSVCAFCDNGGNLLCCDGVCMRSFHATEEDGADSLCTSLGYNQDEVDVIQNFFCRNCEYKQHQCFVCRKLGSSDKSSHAEVFQCVSATCGHFYHPRCVAKWLHREDEDAAKVLEKKIVAGESFTCPIHRCCVCKQVENKKIPDLQLAVCRRCPKSYHRKCLPRTIAFEDIEDEHIITRAWEGLLPNRILIYCLKHEIDDELGTPLRDHVKFPDVVKPAFEENTITVQKKKKKLTSESLASKEKVVPKKKNIASDESLRKKSFAKEPKLTEKSSSEKVDGKKKSETVISGSDVSRKMKRNDTSRKCMSESRRPTSKEIFKPYTEEKSPSLGDKLFAFLEQTKSGKQGDGVVNKTKSVRPKKKELLCALPPLDTETERRLLAMLKEATSAITLEDVMEKHKVASTHGHSLKNVVEKTITIGKLEGSVEAIRTALKKLEEGCGVDDAEAVCDPDLLTQIFKWKNKLKVYLAPFLYGNRYSSYGRHFTQVEKLEGIVAKLHWYVQNGDTIVDFCCGANDFSILMEKKLEETGKKCSYRNYDLFPTKNDFNFEMRDWMSVKPKELPKGSQLIMGLNPPFGVKAALANKFIDKALEFKPKLIILIVPPETQRLDKKRSPYDLVWEDDKFLSGKSFYLPGSCDVNDKQMDQWNLTAPLLYLWSHPEWTAKHKTIAQVHGHLTRQHEGTQTGDYHLKAVTADHPTGTNDHSGDVNMLTDDRINPTDEPENFRDLPSISEGAKESSYHSNADRVSQESHDQRVKQFDYTSRKRKHAEEKDGRGLSEVAPAKERDVGRLPINEMYRGAHYSTQSNLSDSRSSMERKLRYSVTPPPHVEVGNNTYRHLEHSFSGSHAEYGTAYAGSNRWSSGASSLSDYGARNLEEQYRVRPGDSGDSFGYRNYTSEVEEKYKRDADIRTQVRLYGIQDPDSLRSNYLGYDAGYGSLSSSYGQLGLATESSYRMNTSAMQRYAPRLDELNHSRMSTLGPELPIGNRNGVLDQRVPLPGNRGGPMGFAPGPYQASSHQGSAGWLNE